MRILRREGKSERDWGNLLGIRVLIRLIRALNWICVTTIHRVSCRTPMKKRKRRSTYPGPPNGTSPAQNQATAHHTSSSQMGKQISTTSSDGSGNHSPNAEESETILSIVSGNMARSGYTQPKNPEEEKFLGVIAASGLNGRGGDERDDQPSILREAEAEGQEEKGKESKL
ncbi:hypothetical protein BDV19DRAFT_38260 [Aspergillus venezuelensis]